MILVQSFNLGLKLLGARKSFKGKMSFQLCIQASLQKRLMGTFRHA